MARIGKRPAAKAKAKPAEKKERASPSPKDCCGALRGHKSTCKMLLPSERDDDHGIDPTEPDPGQADLLEEVTGMNSIMAGGLGTQFLAALRGVEESLSRIADSMAILAAGGAKTTPVEAQAAPRAPRKPRTPQEPAPATPVAQEPAQAPEDPGGAVDLLDEAPVAPPPKPAPKTAPPAPKGPTADEVRTMFLGFASRKGRDAAVEVLSRFSVAKLGELDAKQYPALVAALKED